MSAPLHSYRTGDVIAGKYRVTSALGSGGMATVLAADHLDLETKVALKILHPQLATDPTVCRRFLREGKNAARIESEHVCRVLDVTRREDGTPMLVLEHLSGQDLSKIVRAQGPFAVEDAVQYLVQICDAVAVAHSLGIVHRDLKPANLFLTYRVDGSPLVKVLDFGIAKAVIGEEALEAALTATSTVVGSPAYMSPEQFHSAKDVDSRADVWSLGMILYRFLTGKGGYAASSLPEVALAIATREPTPILEVRPDLPPGLAAVVMRCLIRDRELRTQSVAELVAALAPFAPPSCRGLLERIQRIGQVTVARGGAQPRESSYDAGVPTPAPAPAPAVLPAPAPSEPPETESSSVTVGAIAREPEPREQDASIPGLTSRRRRLGTIALAAAGVVSLAVIVGALARRAPPSSEQSSTSTPASAAPSAEPRAVGSIASPTPAAISAREPAAPSAPALAGTASAAGTSTLASAAASTATTATTPSARASATGVGGKPTAPRPTATGGKPNKLPNDAWGWGE